VPTQFSALAGRGCLAQARQTYWARTRAGGRGGGGAGGGGGGGGGGRGGGGGGPVLGADSGKLRAGRPRSWPASPCGPRREVAGCFK